MTLYVLDTNIISFIIDLDVQVIANYAKNVLSSDTVLGCSVVWFEIRRGLLAKNAPSKMKRFESLYGKFEWQDYTLSDWELAADLWSQRRLAGRPVADADLLIAVFTINRNAVLVTDNEKDFDGLGAQVENWK